MLTLEQVGLTSSLVGSVAFLLGAFAVLVGLVRSAGRPRNGRRYQGSPARRKSKRIEREIGRRRKV